MSKKPTPGFGDIRQTIAETQPTQQVISIEHSH